MQWVISQHVEPLELSLSQNVAPIVSQQVNSVDHTVHRVEAVGLDSLSWVILQVRSQGAVLETLGPAVNGGLTRLGVDGAETVEVKRVKAGDHLGGTESLVGKLAILVEHTNQVLAINLFQVGLGLLNALSGVSAGSVDRDLSS